MLNLNTSMFQNAHHLTINGGNFVAIQNVIVTSNDSSSMNQIPHLSLPQSPSSLFIGRDTYLQALKDCFSPKPTSERKKILLYGMGGIGKTQICLKFIEQYGKKWFSDIFWIDASSEHAIDLCLRQIAHKYRVDPTPSAHSALDWISKRSDWLMVFDNADKGYQVVEKFIPPGNEGNILITSRDKGLARITSGTWLEVIEMGKEEAKALLFKSSMIDYNSVNVAITAQKLVAALGCIPLAIDQAGAYIHECGCGLEGYLELFAKHRAKLMSDKRFTGASLYQYSTYGTWEISVEEIRCRAEGEDSVQKVEAESALILHNIFAFLHHNNISKEIFEKAAQNFMERKHEITNGLPQSISLLDSKMLFLNDEGNWDAHQFQGGIKVLLSFSLIRINESMYSVHPLIQTWSRDRKSERDASDFCNRSRSLIACSLKLDYQADNYRYCTLLAPHIKRNGEYGAQWVTDNQYYDDQAKIFGFIFDRVGDWNEAEKLFSETLNRNKIDLGADHPDTITAMNMLASTYRNQGRLQEAETLQCQVMETWKKKSGALHPNTLTAMNQLALTYIYQRNEKGAESLLVQVVKAQKEMFEPLHLNSIAAIQNLAITYRNQGKWNEAEDLQVQVMEAWKEKLGPLHQHTLTAMNELALIYSYQGKEKEAESLSVQVMRACKEKLGMLHPETLTAIHNLAVTYRNQGKWDEAEGLLVQVMEGRKERLGPLHSYTVAAMNELVVTYRYKGKQKEAESLHVQVVEAQMKRLGALHPDTLTAIHNLAVTYKNQGKWNEAESLQVRVMEARKEKFGPLHQDTLTAMSELAVTYSKQGKWNEAKGLQVQVMEARQKELEAFHPYTLVAMNELALTYSYQGKEKEAESLKVQVMEGWKEKVGPLHPYTLTAMHNLAVTYRNQEKWDEAEGLLVQVMEAQKEKLGLLHPHTITAMNELASTYTYQGKQKEAESLQIQVVEAQKERHGALHPDTLMAMNNLAVIYKNHGKLKEAESLLDQVIEGRKENSGPLHPDTLIAMANMALVYKDQSRLKEAKELLETSINSMQQVLGADHPTSISFMQVLTDNTWHAEGKASKNSIKGALQKAAHQINKFKIKAKKE